MKLSRAVPLVLFSSFALSVPVVRTDHEELPRVDSEFGLPTPVVPPPCRGFELLRMLCSWAELGLQFLRWSDLLTIGIQVRLFQLSGLGLSPIQNRN